MTLHGLALPQCQDFVLLNIEKIEVQRKFLEA